MKQLCKFALALTFLLPVFGSAATTSGRPRLTLLKCELDQGATLWASFGILESSGIHFPHHIVYVDATGTLKTYKTFSSMTEARQTEIRLLSGSLQINFGAGLNLKSLEVSANTLGGHSYVGSLQTEEGQKLSAFCTVF